MKIGFCMLLWTTSVDHSHRALLEDIKATGYDGVEIPIFGGEPDEYAALGAMLDDIGLERTGITVIPTPEQSPVSPDATVRQAAVDYLEWVASCAGALGASGVGGPLHQTLGEFSGQAPNDDERQRAADVHRKAGDIAARHGVTFALEALNRFECYFANTMDDLATYVRMVDHPNIKAMYDTFHANIEEQDPIAAFTRNSDTVVHVHISENDRGVPGRGHVPWEATFEALKASGYDQWLTIEAFGRGLPELAAATRVWRDFAESHEAYYRDGYRHISEGWAGA